MIWGEVEGYKGGPRRFLESRTFELRKSNHFSFFIMFDFLSFDVFQWIVFQIMKQK